MRWNQLLTVLAPGETTYLILLHCVQGQCRAMISDKTNKEHVEIYIYAQKVHNMYDNYTNIINRPGMLTMLLLVHLKDFGGHNRKLV